MRTRKRWNVAPYRSDIDRVVAPDARIHELEAIGYPRGPKGFKIFRRQVNTAIPGGHIFVTAVRFEGDDIQQYAQDSRRQRR